MKLGPLEIGLIVGAVVLLFGATKVAELGKGIGRAIGNFRREVKAEKLEEGDHE